MSEILLTCSLRFWQSPREPRASRYFGKFANSTRSQAWRPKCPFFFGLVSGYWVCYQFFSIPLSQEEIRAGLWNLPKSTRRQAWSPECPLFLDWFLATGFATSFSASRYCWDKFGLGSEICQVPGARPGAQNAHFFWIGFWLLGLLPVFQLPIKAGANLGWALEFAKVFGARPGGQNV